MNNFDYNLELFKAPFENGELYDSLFEFYNRFEPKAVYDGLPPTRTEATQSWLKDLLREGNIHVTIHSKFHNLDKSHPLVAHGMLLPLDDGKRAEVALFVHQDFRGKGLGERLLSALLHHACHSEHLSQAILQVDSSNPTALHLYRKMDFKRHGCSSLDSEQSLTRNLSCPNCKGNGCPAYSVQVAWNANDREQV